MKKQSKIKNQKSKMLIGGIWLAILVLLAIPHCRAADPIKNQKSKIKNPVESGRDALNEGWISSQYRWYDAETDDVRKIAPAPQFSQWVADVWTSIWSWLQRFNFSFTLFNMRVSLFKLLGILALLGLVAVLVYLLNKLYRKQQARRAAGLLSDVAAIRRTDADRIEALPMPVERGPRDLLGQAEDAYRRGDYGEAIKFLFSHQLVELDRNQLVRLMKGKTNRQYLRELRPREALQRLVERTMVAFEDVFFGNHALERSRFEACWSDLDRFKQLLHSIV
jgi:hypothetical protein